MKHSIVILFIIFIGVGCDQTNVDSAEAPPNPFFDLKDYFENEMKIKRNEVTKTTIFEAQKEITQISNIDLEKELKIFADANLNKVAWYEKYKIETQQTSQGNSQTTYQTQDSKLKTKRIDIFKNETQIDSIKIHNQMTSMIMDADQFLSYYPGVGYHIEIKQKGNLKEVGDMTIEVEY